MSDYKEKYTKYKNKYVMLKNKIHGGAVINGNANIHTIVTNVFKNNVIRSMTPKYQCIINSLNYIMSNNIDLYMAKKFNNIEQQKERFTYKSNRYTENNTKDCENNTIIKFRNNDDSLDFIIHKNKFLKNIYFSDFNKPEYISEVETNWIDFNWAIVRDSATKQFEMTFVSIKDNNIEFGAKHTMLGLEKDLYMAGEGRIIKNNDIDKFYIQFNLNSSSWDTNNYIELFKSLLEGTPDITRGDYSSIISEFFSLKLTDIIKTIIRNDPVQIFKEAACQVVKLTLKMDAYGVLTPENTMYNPIPYEEGGFNDGLLYYYKPGKDKTCPTDKFINEANKFKIQNNKLYEIYPKINRGERDIDYIHFDDILINIKNNTIVKNDYTGEWGLEILDNDIITICQKRIGDKSFIESLNVLEFLGIDAILQTIIQENQKLSNFNGINCVEEGPIIYSPKRIQYNNLSCFKSQGAGSGAYILKLNDATILKGNIIKRNALTIHDFINKFKFLVEAWANDYLRRKVYSIPGLCDNFCKIRDIFLCHKQLPHENPLRNNNCQEGYLSKIPNQTELFGFITMELIDGTLGDFMRQPQNIFTYGMLFEYMYGKLVAYKTTNIIFTDQANSGNCGYKAVDYCRHYVLKYAGKILNIYVNDPNMIKILDFDNFKFGTNNNFYHEVNDIINTTPVTQHPFIKRNTEPVLSRQLCRGMISSFATTSQVNNFFRVVKKSLPDSYKSPLPGKRIERFVFEY
jgi:hypothetical protein